MIGGIMMKWQEMDVSSVVDLVRHARILIVVAHMTGIRPAQYSLICLMARDLAHPTADARPLHENMSDFLDHIAGFSGIHFDTTGCCTDDAYEAIRQSPILL
jgi:hypothetical protein